MIQNALKSNLTIVYALLCYITSIIGLTWFVGFEENLWFGKTIDHGEEYHPFSALVVNIGLLLLFGIFHSGMARVSFKRWLAKYVPPHLERSTYTLTAGLILILICWMWRPMTVKIYDLNGTNWGNALLIINFSGLVLMTISMDLFDAKKLCGWHQIVDYFGINDNQSKIQNSIFYQLASHPSYLGIFIVLWSSTSLTLGHLLFSSGMTIYIFIGIHFEEKDLIKSYGQDYIDYAKRTSRAMI